MSKFILKVLSSNNTSFSVCTTWTLYKHSKKLELMQLLPLDGYMLVSMVMLNNGFCCDIGLYIYTGSIYNGGHGLTGLSGSPNPVLPSCCSFLVDVITFFPLPPKKKKKLFFLPVFLINLFLPPPPPPPLQKKKNPRLAQLV